MPHADIFQQALLSRIECAEIDGRDGFYFLGPASGQYLKHLYKTIREQGPLRPLWAQRCAEGGYRVVDGFARLGAALDVGLKSLPALVFPPDANPVGLFRARLDGRAGVVSAVAGARALQRIEAVAGYDIDLLLEFTEWMGFSGGLVQLERLRSLRGLEEPVARWCEENLVGPAEAAAMAAFPREGQRGLLVLLRAVNPGGNLLRRYLALIAEISAREGILVEEALSDRVIRSVLTNPQTACSAGRELVHRRLRELRYPETTALEERFKLAVKALGLPETVRIEPPEAFEGDRITVGFGFGDPGELEETAASLALAARSDAARELFRCLGAPDERESGSDT